ncbi:MAG: conjugal transfer protein TraF [Brachymonas sp.]|nr:conjugal transfer protein TraF [Brachymonas sp.]
MFADVWRRTLWNNPELDYSQRGGRPTGAVAVNSFDKQYQGTMRSSIAALSQTHGVYFFFRGDCPYCHAMAPTLKMLEQQHGLKIIAISMDGGSLPQFPRAVKDAGQSQQIGVKSVPSFFLVKPSDRSIYPLGTGVISYTDLEDRIYTQGFTQPGSKF